MKRSQRKAPATQKPQPIDFEQQFEAIAQRAIEEAEAIKCDFGTFVEGLKAMTSLLQHRLEGAIDEQG